MPSRLLPVIVPAAAAVLLSGCAIDPAPGSIGHYVAAPSLAVETTCGGGYRVYRRPGEETVLVAAYAISEAVQTMCEQRRGLLPESGATGVRHEEAVVEYIAKTPTLKGCTVVSGIAHTSLHSEFTLACPAKTEKAVRAKG
jgi:threonine dehydratase